MPGETRIPPDLVGLARCAAALGRITGVAEWFRDDFSQRLARRLDHVASGAMPLDADLEYVLAQVNDMAPLLEQLDGALMSLTGTARQCAELLGKPD